MIRRLDPVQMSDYLPALRVVLCGYRWRTLGGAQYLWRGDELRLVYDIALDVRERAVEELRPDVAAMWADPRERLGLV
jgi:hypothetical protein